MATLADSFLADFESSDEEEENEEEEAQVPAAGDDDGGDGGETKQPEEDPTALPDVEIEEIDFDAEMDDDAEKKGADEQAQSTASGVAKLLSSVELANHLAQVETLMQKTQKEDGTHLGVDREEEYDVIVRSNALATKIDNEIATIHGYVRSLYATKFTELEQLVANPVDYAKVVKVIGNLTDLRPVENDLGALLPPHQILTISVTSTTTIGQPLPKPELTKVLDGCDAIIALDDHKRRIFEYVESRMIFIAPNVSAIVGSDVAARLLGIAGGLSALSKIPACNIQVLGANRGKNLAGFSAQGKDLHMGVLMNCPVLYRCPPAFKGKALRLVAGKVVLASRIDAFCEDPEGLKGRQMHEDIEKKIDKWQQPPPAKLVKALPVPNDTPRKKRGGKRYRKQREKFMVTELLKQKNRMMFNKKEATDEYTGEGYGMLGAAGSGLLTVRGKDKQNLKNHLSRKTQARLRRVQGTSTGTEEGQQSTIAFTPVQGIELVSSDPLLKVKDANDKYFSTTGAFFKVGANKRQKKDEEAVEVAPKQAAEKPWREWNAANDSDYEREDITDSDSD